MLNDEDLITSERLLKEIRNRIDYLLNVGLSLFSLSRKSNTLSGGEFQRLNLLIHLQALWLAQCIF